MTTMTDTTMSHDEYRAALDKLGLNQQAAGRLFGVGSRTARRWALNEARIPVPVVLLMRLMLKKRLRLEIPIWDEEARDWSENYIWTFSAERKLE
jgi:DNA-binding transcriptional regulator YiaG